MAMASEAIRALQCETDFLSGVDAKLQTARGSVLRGTLWEQVRDDESDRLRALMAENRVYDRELLKSLPANRRIVLRGFERRFWFGRRRTGVAVASVLTPLSHFAGGAEGETPPVGLGALRDHVERLVTDRKVPHVVGICSPSGFSEEARTARLDRPNLSIVLVEPDQRGGWKTTAAGESGDPRLLHLFDPEGHSDKLERVRKALEARGGDLLTGGVSVSSVAASVDLPEPVVRQVFAQVAEEDPELRSATRDGETLLYRGAPVQVQEKKAMNVIDRIRQMFSGEGNESEKINLLAERRALLAQRRDRIYEDIAKLEENEQKLLEQGRAATAANATVKCRRLAAQLAQFRKDIGRQNTTAAMLNQQINIISTDIHNLTLIQQGEMAQLPETEELTQNAVKAEEMLETLKADSELVGTLELGMEEAVASDEELAILSEFAQTEEKPAPEKTAGPAESRLSAAQPEGAGAHGDLEPSEEPSARAPEQRKDAPDAEAT